VLEEGVDKPEILFARINDLQLTQAGDGFFYTDRCLTNWCNFGNQEVEEGTWLTPEQIRNIIKSFQTTLIDVTLTRLPSPKVFEIIRGNDSKGRGRVV
jgi:hypothetical protein